MPENISDGDPEEGSAQSSTEITPASSTEVDSDGSDRTGFKGVLVPGEAFADMFRDWALRRQPQKTAVFPHPFVIDEDTLRRLDARVSKRLAEYTVEEPVLQIIVGYSDLGSESFADWETCFEEAVETSDAERLEAAWEGVDHAGGIYRVVVRCVTEQPLVTARALGPVPEEARIEATVTGPTRDWINSTLRLLEPILGGARLSKLFRPLELFRSLIVREIGAWAVGAIAWYVSFQLLQELVAEPDNESRLHKILSHHTLAERFEAFIHDFYGPQQSFVVGFFVFMLPWGLFWAGLLIGRRVLAYVVPRSAINIGMATKRYREYMNVFRFVVFTVFVGTILAIIANLLSSLL